VLACRQLLRQSAGIRHRVCVVGGNDAGERAALLGLEAHARVAPPFSRPELALMGIQNLIEEWGPPTIVMCWGGDCAALRERVLAGRRGRDRRDSPASRATWMVADMHAGVLEVHDLHHTREPLTQAMTPWLPVPGALLQRERESIREELRVENDVLLVALVGDPPAATDAITLAYMAGILHVAGLRITPVVPRGSYQLERALRHLAAGGYLSDIRLIDAPISLIAPGCDLGICAPVALSEQEVLCEPSLPSKLAVARACGMGLPVVMAGTPWARALLPEGAQACLAPTSHHAALAKRVFALLEDGHRPLRSARAALIERSVSVPSRGLTEEVLAAWARVGVGGAAAATQGRLVTS
jgi:hypothetical protein